ncbi:MAG: hypothetical protein HY743_02205 [Deltaproteobacteria bacterium]|nr:hypothetical protein [Deltaproteobacteria bacterium]
MDPMMKPSISTPKETYGKVILMKGAVVQEVFSPFSKGGSGGILGCGKSPKSPFKKGGLNNQLSTYHQILEA